MADIRQMPAVLEDLEGDAVVKQVRPPNLTSDPKARERPKPLLVNTWVGTGNLILRSSEEAVSVGLNQETGGQTTRSKPLGLRLHRRSHVQLLVQQEELRSEAPELPERWNNFTASSAHLLQTPLRSTMAAKATPDRLTCEPEVKERSRKPRLIPDQGSSSKRMSEPSSSTRSPSAAGCSQEPGGGTTQQRRLSVQPLVERFRDHREKKHQKRSAKAQEQYERWNAFKESYPHLLARHHEMYTDGLRMSRNNMLKNLF